MTAPRPDSTASPASPEAASNPAPASRTVPRNDRRRPARRDNPHVSSPALRRGCVPQPRRAARNEEPSAAQPSFDELDRWDEEWRGEWDRGDVDDSAAYDDELDVADQTRDVEWLLDALDALDDNGSDDDEFDWE